MQLRHAGLVSLAILCALATVPAAGALACTRFGAQPSMPTAAEIKIIMADQKP